MTLPEVAEIREGEGERGGEEGEREGEEGGVRERGGRVRAGDREEERRRGSSHFSMSWINNLFCEKGR